MATTFATRVRASREHAKLSQGELARRLGIRPQAIQYLEDPKNHARGSRHTASIASICGVDAQWLASDKGSMLPSPAAGVRHEHAGHEALSAEAKDIALAWSQLPLEAKGWMREIMFMFATIEKHYPSLRRGRPKSESYSQYEKRIEQNFNAMIQLAASRTKTRAP